MKRRKVFALLAVCGVLVGAGATGVQAKTIGIDNGDGTVSYYYCYPVEESAEAAEQEELAYRIKGPMESSEDVSTESSAESGESVEILEETDEIQKTVPKTGEVLKIAEESGEAMASGTDSDWAGEVSAEMDYRLMLTKEEKEREARRTDAYKKAGIEQDKQGAWLWNGRKIHFLLDDDGSIFCNGTEEARGNRLYVYVSRNAEGEVIKAEMVEGKEVLEKMALADVGETAGK